MNTNQSNHTSSQTNLRVQGSQYNEINDNINVNNNTNNFRNSYFPSNTQNQNQKVNSKFNTNPTDPNNPKQVLSRSPPNRNIQPRPQTSTSPVNQKGK
jgi:hypothetical protein